MITRIQLQPAWILHTRPYGDTSLLIDWLTQDYGRVRSVARSARGPRSRFRGILQSFMPFLISWSGKSELVSLQQAEMSGAPIMLQGVALLSGLYINELLVRLLLAEDPHPRLYLIYHQTLARLQDDGCVQYALRLFEKELLSELGYGLALDKETHTGNHIEPEAWYYLEPQRGLSRCQASTSDRVFLGKQLLAVQQAKLQNTEDLQAAKRLMRLLLAPLLGDKPLQSRELFKNLGAVKNAHNP